MGRGSGTAGVASVAAELAAGERFFATRAAARMRLRMSAGGILLLVMVPLLVSRLALDFLLVMISLLLASRLAVDFLLVMVSLLLASRLALDFLQLVSLLEPRLGDGFPAGDGPAAGDGSGADWCPYLKRRLLAAAWHSALWRCSDGRSLRRLPFFVGAVVCLSACRHGIGFAQEKGWCAQK